MIDDLDKSVCTCTTFTDAHAHCTSCGTMLFAEGGGGDDGKKIGGYTDASPCARCGDYACYSSDCLRLGRDGVSKLCAACHADDELEYRCRVVLALREARRDIFDDLLSAELGVMTLIKARGESSFCYKQHRFRITTKPHAVSERPTGAIEHPERLVIDYP